MTTISESYTDAPTDSWVATGDDLPVGRSDAFAAFRAILVSGAISVALWGLGVLILLSASLV